MEEKELMSEALGIREPWYVTEIKFSVEEKRLDIYVDFTKGARFMCPTCGREDGMAYDRIKRTWRHLNFFQHTAYIHAKAPRVQCPKGCLIKNAELPWTRRNSSFTLLFEAFIMTLAKQMPVNAIARLVREHDTRLWRVLNHYVDKARQKEDYCEVTKIGIDETASKKGHKYLTLFMDLEKSKLIYATEGKDHETVISFCKDLSEHKGNPEKIKEVSSDLSPAFIKGIKEQLKQAAITFDRFHVMKIINEAVDKVRRAESEKNVVLKKTKYLWLKNKDKLNDNQRMKLENFLEMEHLETSKAYRLKLLFQEIFSCPDRETAKNFLSDWCDQAEKSNLVPIMKSANTIKAHLEGILNWFDSKISNGILEGTNSLIQAAKARARGYRSSKNLITMAYIIAGKLDFHSIYPC